MNTILFDLDGTLLPMDLEEFEHDYFKRVCGAFPEILPDSMIKAIWTGVKAIVKNNGSMSNREAFAAAFSSLGIMDFYENEERFLQFYRTDFQECVKACRVTDLSRRIIHILKEKGYKLVIATNPIFPQIATYSRLKWLGLDADDFLLVTTYENSSHAKPNPEYYSEICDKLSLNPADCVMIGNDTAEDGSAAAAGMDVIIVSDCLINKGNLPLDNYTVITLEGLIEWASRLPEQI